MKNKKILISVVAVLILVLVGGIAITRTNNSDGNNESTNTTTTPTPISTDDKKILVAYFSVPETDKTESLTQDEENSTVLVDGETLGNTQYVANLISEEIGAEIYRIEPVNAYPTDHDELLDRVLKEMRNDDRPQIKNPISNLSEYDIIFLGYPIWNADLPPIIYSFLENNNFDGKMVIPFCTHGGSGLSDTANSISEILSNAEVITNGFSISRDDMETAPQELSSWLEKIGIK